MLALPCVRIGVLYLHGFTSLCFAVVFALLWFACHCFVLLCVAFALPHIVLFRLFCSDFLCYASRCFALLSVALLCRLALLGWALLGVLPCFAFALFCVRPVLHCFILLRTFVCCFAFLCLVLYCCVLLRRVLFCLVLLCYEVCRALCSPWFALHCFEHVYFLFCLTSLYFDLHCFAPHCNGSHCFAFWVCFGLRYLSCFVLLCFMLLCFVFMCCLLLRSHCFAFALLCFALLRFAAFCLVMYLFVLLCIS